MKKACNLFSIFTLFLFACSQQKPAPKIMDLVDYVNPLVGTESSYELSHGNTYPAIAVPWGMNFWTPQTGKMGDGWVYTYTANKIKGIRQIHQPSPWINDYGAFAFMAMTDSLKINEDDRASTFSHNTEVVHPYYYKVELSDYSITAELTPTDRAAIVKFTFPETKSAYIILDAFSKGSQVKVIPSENKIIGYSKNNNGGVPDNFASYFVAQFSKPFSIAGVWRNDTILPEALESTGNHTGAYLKFETAQNEAIEIRVASSFISIEQAQRNLDTEINNASFEEVKSKAKAHWNNELNKIQVEGGTHDQFTTFYTALYRTLLFPRKFYEIDAKNQIIHYSPYNGKVETGYMFTDNGFWDTFRAVYPLFTIAYPELDAQVMQGLVNAYKEGGWLPEWASPGYRDCMIGAHAASLLTDAYIKGIRDFDVETAFQAMVKDATDSTAPMPAVGRYGVNYYNQMGYVPVNIGINESASRTIEYAYDDFCMMQMAKALGKSEVEIEMYRKKALNYRNVFDVRLNFMRGKNVDGSWQTPFNPATWGGAFTEGSSWHYTWSVFHDPQGLINLMGGDQAFVAKLDSVFSAPPDFDFSYYGIQIHEITEMVNCKMGQYAHGNQPIQHAIYLYDYAGEPWKTQQWIRKVMDQLYGPGPDGLCGDEDNGQTSAWYVFSAMGFYPVCPGYAEYAIGSPLFKKITLNLPANKQFIIKASTNSNENVFIKSASLNGSNFTQNYINHTDIINGGKLVFDMSNTPNKARGTKAEDRPSSLTDAEQASIPFFTNDLRSFTHEIRVDIKSVSKNATIYYTTDGSVPNTNSKQWKAPLVVKETTTFKAFAAEQGKQPSDIIEAKFYKIKVLEPIDTKEIVKGLRYIYYEVVTDKMPDFKTLKSKKTGLCTTIGTSIKQRSENYAIIYTGFLKIPYEGIYTFYLTSDDGSCLAVGQSEIINNDGLHGATTKTATIALKAGLYPVELKYFNQSSNSKLLLQYACEKFVKREIADTEIFSLK